MKKTILSIALSAAYSVAIAESKPTEIVITAKGQQSLNDVAATSHVITQKDIKESQSSDIVALLDSVSGISITRNGSRGTVSSTFIRGADSSQIIVLVDGIRVGSATLGSTELGHIPLEFVERIEVVKGPLSGLYGADAIGGVIQIFTKKPAQSQSSVKLSAGSFGHEKASIAFSSSNFRISASREENTGIDSTTTVTEGNEDEDGFEETAINIGANFSLGNLADVSITGFFADNEIEFDNTFGADTGFLTENEISTISANFTGKYSDAIKWSSVIGFTNNDSFTEAFSSQADTQRLSLSSQLEIKLSSNHLLILGSDYYDEEITTLTPFPEDSRDNTGAFSQLQSQFGQFGVVANLRFDDNSAYGSQTNGSLALTYSLSQNTRLTASYGTAFRAPTFNELFFPDFGNPNLEPEESQTFEISLRGNAGNTQWRISAYDTTIDNLIEFAAPTFLPANINEASLQGVEFELGTKIGQWSLSGSLNFLDATDEATGLELVRRPEQTLKISVDRALGNFGFGADLLAENGRFDAGTELDSFQLINLRAAYKITDKFNISAKAGNLFDEDYELASGFNTEGRSVFVTANLTF